ncbi:MAG: hypothetical protein ACK559_08860, partial [bacterium]
MADDLLHLRGGGRDEVGAGVRVDAQLAPDLRDGDDHRGHQRQDRQEGPHRALLVLRPQRFGGGDLKAAAVAVVVGVVPVVPPDLFGVAVVLAVVAGREDVLGHDAVG